MATANASMDSIKWSTETYRLDEVSTHFTLPIMVRLSEGICEYRQSGTFSAYDVIKLEKEVSLSKVAAHFIFDLNEWRSKLGRGYDQYVSLHESNEILIPLHYKGLLHIIGEESICENVFEISKTNAKYVMVLKNVVVPQSRGSITLQAGTVLEIDRSFTVPCVKGGNKIIVCTYDLNKVRCKVELPITMNGKFKIINDETTYTLQQVIDKCTLPQAVKFVDSDIQEMYCRDIVGGVENIVHCSGILSLNRLIKQKVLIGYFKPLDAGPVEKIPLFRPPIVVLPLDSWEVKEIEVSVPQMPPEENDIYQFVMDNTCLSDRTWDLTNVDENLYAEFAKCPKVHILNEDLPPLYPKPSSTDDLPPPVPPRPRKLAPVSAEKGQNSYENMTRNPHVLDPKDKIFGIKETNHAVDFSAKVSPTKAEETEQKLHDLPDLSKLDLRTVKMRTAHVSPQTKTIPGLNQPDKTFRELTEQELYERLELCGFEKLIDICRNGKLDGRILHGVEEKYLAKSPFNLTEFQIRKFREMVHKNWIPKST
ncbi:hypothetical protein ACJMK2_039005 [Sinanodonta woodiana]|uniref:CABIT domain-containing protein n=1 Tax=Sinanodonta woodiana TaxID=1069815 RepID=A0ABD3WAP6_SINWO